MKNKKMIFGGAAILLALYAMGQKKEAQPVCPNNEKLFLAENKKVCEFDLPDMGYIYWRDGTAGAGWYSLNDFMNVFGFPAEIVTKTLIDSAAQANDPTHPNMQTAQNFLINAVKPTAVILKQL